MEIKLLIFAAGILVGASAAFLLAVKDMKRVRKEYSQLLHQYKTLIRQMERDG